MITLFTTHCPQCNVLEKKLREKNIDFKLVDNEEEVEKVAIENKIWTTPLLKVDDKVMNFSDAISWLRSM